MVLPPMSVAYALEKQVAISAVLRACSLTSSVFNKLVKNETVTKDDKSPVTGLSWPGLFLESDLLAACNSGRLLGTGTHQCNTSACISQ